ncbi:MAG: hypothetical protein J2P31_11905 [Blastocatellia bacterium]|nr:hypothetical protein [Blastocatellia bacterium]
MKQIFCLIFLLMEPWFVLQQDQQSTNVCRPAVKYDRDADMTTVRCDLIEQVMVTGRLMVSATVVFRGKEPNEESQFWLSLGSYKGGANRRTPPSFKEATTLYLMADSLRLEVAVKDYSKELFETNSLLAEEARAKISREDLQKLANARRIEGKWGSAEFKFSDAALASLKNFISRQVSTANGR